MTCFAASRWLKPFAVTAVMALALAAPVAHAGPIPSGWTCAGACGTDGADGVVTLSPIGSSAYEYITTTGGTNGVGALAGVGGSGSPTNGSTLTTPVFSANASDPLNFDFNFVTSDGSGYADYAWAELLTSSGTSVAILFTARTASSGSIVPGFSMPTPAATLSPSAVDIIGGAPTWSPLGGYSGQCYAAGCGYTGWVGSSYSIAAAGSYYLEFGVTNWNDTSYDTGMAIDGVTVAGQEIPGQGSVPEPASLMLLASGIAGVWFARRSRPI